MEWFWTKEVSHSYSYELTLEFPKHTLLKCELYAEHTEYRRTIAVWKVTLFLYRPRDALRAPGFEIPRISKQSAHEGGRVVSPTYQPPLPTGDIPGTHFFQRPSRLQSRSAVGMIKSSKYPNDLTGNQTRDLPACNAGSQETASPHVHDKP
jgi:hypothetical protein